MAALMLLPATGRANVRCYWCGCNDQVFEDVADCNADCPVTLGCAGTGICDAIELPGREPTIIEDVKERLGFGFPLTCYSVLADPDPTYNCIASTVGDENNFLWEEVDLHYGDGDGVVTVDDFDSFYGAAGYVESDSCALVSGKEKIALYGVQDSNGDWVPTHAANQSAFDVGGDWWESKEGEYKKIMHKIDDVKSKEYGDVIKCYER